MNVLLTKEELAKQIKTGGFFSDELLALIEQYGIENIRFGFESDSIFDLGKITEVNYEIRHNYKIEFVMKTTGDKERFYIADFCALIRSGQVGIYIETEDGIECIYQEIKDIWDEDELHLDSWLSNFFNRINIKRASA